ncbi:hypothetical protein BDA99DRAFT_519436 [Phascolomyces articulosus]|uniref:Uncharacterized protein n=1 Tax=Phascolomyces articulosus TaxID=60185 RepID=A0AAD5PCH6_9FUNG|nr:hypothetical protein BDA99DRAFT_519436 [Phascolomyces articulosus]
MDETIRQITLSVIYIFISLLVGVLLFVWFREIEVSLHVLVHLLFEFCFTQFISAYFAFVHDITPSS